MYIHISIYIYAHTTCVNPDMYVYVYIRTYISPMTLPDGLWKKDFHGFSGKKVLLLPESLILFN